MEDFSLFVLLSLSSFLILRAEFWQATCLGLIHGRTGEKAALWG
jgi:hypothetical protein